MLPSCSEHRNHLSFEDIFLPFGGKLSGDNRWPIATSCWGRSTSVTRNALRPVDARGGAGEVMHRLNPLGLDFRVCDCRDRWNHRRIRGLGNLIPRQCTWIRCWTRAHLKQQAVQGLLAPTASLHYSDRSLQAVRVSNRMVQPAQQHPVSERSLSAWIPAILRHRGGICSPWASV